MRERTLAVYDRDPVYGSRFADYVNQKENLPFRAIAFGSLEKLQDYARAHPIEILLIDSQSLEEAQEIPARQTICLQSGEEENQEEKNPAEKGLAVYKYQSGDSIVREVMACYCQQAALQPALALAGTKATVMTVFSPVNRCLKTSFALTMGQLMARSQRVLYMNLEEYSGFSGLVQEKYGQDLSDVLYLYKQGAYHWLKLKSMVYSWGGLEYIPPVRYGEDLSQVSAEEMAGLIGRIAVESGYERILVDVGHMGSCVLPILEISDVIYMPVKEDCISQAKILEFEEYLEAAGAGALRERLRKLKLPYHSSFGQRENYMEQLLWGELGDYVRQLLRGGKGL